VNEKRSLLAVALAALACEKTVQHVFVTLAFLLGYGGIRESVVVDYRVLVVVGSVLAVLFAASVPLVWRGRERGFALLFALGVFDVASEFVAQGTFAIHVVVSSLVAWAIVLLSLARWWLRRRLAGPSGHRA